MIASAAAILCRRRRPADLLGRRHGPTQHEEAVTLFDAAEELDWAGPWEVLSMWARGWPDDDVEVSTVADSLEPVTCAKGLPVLAGPHLGRSGTG
jgi:hypothetical protein